MRARARDRRASPPRATSSRAPAPVAPAADDTPQAALRALQRSIGNHAVNGLLQAGRGSAADGREPERATTTRALAVAEAHVHRVTPRIQPKRTYINYDGNHVEVIRKKLRALEVREKLTPLSDREFIYGLTGLTVSPLDYGVIDLSDDQHLMLLYHYISKQAMPLKSERTVDRGEGTEPEQEPIEAQEAEAREEQEAWKQAKQEQESSKGAKGSVFKVAFLGAGASIAYYLATLSANFERDDGVIIGPDQPWSGKRGPGVVAHPEHMITPLLQFVGITEIDDTWLERGKFSRLITQALRQSGFQRERGAVTALKKEGTFYEITVAGLKKPIYASEVVSGVGVGEHKPPAGVSEATTPDEIPQKRIMDMDLFTNVADRLGATETGIVVGSDTKSDKSQITVVLSGGNGGIDVAFDALNKGYKVHWIVGQGGPKFLPGFFNYAAYLPYLRTLKESKQEGKAKIKDPDAEIKKAQAELAGLYEDQEDMFDGVIERFMPETKKFEGVYFGYLDSATKDPSGVTAKVKGYPAITGDVLVYAQGQDNATFNLFTSFMKDLVPDTDVSKRFGEEGETTLGLTSSDDTLKIIGATAYRLAPQIAATASQIETLYQQLNAAREAVGKLIHGKLDYLPFSSLWFRYYLFQAAVSSKGDVKGALQALAEACKQYDAYRSGLDTDALSPDEAKALQAFDVAQSKARGKAQGLMQPVISSLPDNVLINDQLTPTRSQIVASTGFVPYDISRRANFITDDRTVLAVHISAHYPKLADTYQSKLDGLIQQIIDSRTKAVEDGPEFRPVPPHGRAFQQFWEKRLVELNA